MSDIAKKTPKTRVAKVEQAEKIIVGIDKSNEIILQLNMDESVVLAWDSGSFRRLPNEIVERLRPENMRSYLVAETKAEDRASRVSRIEVLKNPLNPISGYSEFREMIRKRLRWHQCWANPGRDFDEKMRGPYKQVRLQKEGEKREPGEENGEVLKRLNGEGKVEAIALECPEHLFQAYLEWMSAQSGVRKTELKQDFFTAMENINRELPKAAHILPIDDEGELQE